MAHRHRPQDGRARSQARSSLYRIPRELRIMIYRQMAVQNTVSNDYRIEESYYEHYGRPGYDGPRENGLIKMAMTCKLFYREILDFHCFDAIDFEPNFELRVWDTPPGQEERHRRTRQDTTKMVNIADFGAAPHYEAVPRMEHEIPSTVLRYAPRTGFLDIKTNLDIVNAGGGLSRTIARMPPAVQRRIKNIHLYPTHRNLITNPQGMSRDLHRTWQLNPDFRPNKLTVTASESWWLRDRANPNLERRSDRPYNTGPAGATTVDVNDLDIEMQLRFWPHNCRIFVIEIEGDGNVFSQIDDMVAGPLGLNATIFNNQEWRPNIGGIWIPWQRPAMGVVGYEEYEYTKYETPRRAIETDQHGNEIDSHYITRQQYRPSHVRVGNPKDQLDTGLRVSPYDVQTLQPHYRLIRGSRVIFTSGGYAGAIDPPTVPADSSRWAMRQNGWRRF